MASLKDPVLGSRVHAHDAMLSYNVWVVALTLLCNRLFYGRAMAVPKDIFLVLHPKLLMLVIGLM